MWFPTAGPRLIMALSFRGMAGDEAGSKMRGYYSLNEDFRARNYLVA